MGRLFCMLLLASVIFASVKTAGVHGAEAAQPVFFSMLFPQLMPQQEANVMCEDECQAKAVML